MHLMPVWSAVFSWNVHLLSRVFTLGKETFKSTGTNNSNVVLEYQEKIPQEKAEVENMIC